MRYDPTLKYRVRCGEDRDQYLTTDLYEYFKTMDDAKAWIKRAVKAGRFKRFVIQDMRGGMGRWVVLEEIRAPKPRTSN